MPRQIPAKLLERLQARFMPQSDAMCDAFAFGAVLYGEGYGLRQRQLAAA